jgi:hypothetical protein
MARAKRKFLDLLILLLFVFLSLTTMAQPTSADEKCHRSEIFFGIAILDPHPESKSRQELKRSIAHIANLATVGATSQQLLALDKSLRLGALRAVWENNCSQDVKLSRHECRELAAEILKLAGCQHGTNETICRKICPDTFDPKTVDADNIADECVQEGSEEAPASGP